ncbi:hypothetical protein AAEY46_004263 [Yersinia enterocolitica]|nr:hypothetical protein [Yersinia enterocolitica]HEI6761019.1 hypothetical protein [Yersinia enterocolitica]HEI6825609.1 hypothetical protein [Yersinia enterocolitica]HEI6868707.1 hypothetical protein [Yersinia enterocolitica]
MEWRGIPFPETVERIVTNTSLAIDKIPKVYIDTGDNTWSVTATMIATILGSLIAGSIPAAIAWRTIKKNQESVEKDRAAQQASFDKDREAQLLIATRSFNAQVLSTNRQAWINELRDIITEFISSVDPYITSYKDHIVASDAYKECKKIYEKEVIKTNILVEGLNEFRNKYESSRIERQEQDKAINKLITRTSLMLNPKEDLYTKILVVMNEIYILPKKNKIADDYASVEFYTTVFDKSEYLIKQVQQCLKEEWEKVKVGR